MIMLECPICHTKFPSNSVSRVYDKPECRAKGTALKHAKWYEDHKDNIQQQKKDAYQKNRGTLIAKSQAWQSANKEKYKKYQVQYRKTHKTQLSKTNHANYLKNIDKLKNR